MYSLFQIEFGILLTQFIRERQQLLSCNVRGYAGSQSSPHAYPAWMKHIGQSRAAFYKIRILLHWHEYIRILSIQAGEELRNNPDDRCRLLVQANHSANHRGVSAEALLPELVTQYNHGRSIRRVIVARIEQSAGRCTRS